MKALHLSLIVLLINFPGILHGLPIKPAIIMGFNTRDQELVEKSCFQGAGLLAASAVAIGGVQGADSRLSHSLAYCALGLLFFPPLFEAKKKKYISNQAVLATCAAIECAGSMGAHENNPPMAGFLGSLSLALAGSCNINEQRSLFSNAVFGCISALGATGAARFLSILMGQD